MEDREQFILRLKSAVRWINKRKKKQLAYGPCLNVVGGDRVVPASLLRHPPHVHLHSFVVRVCRRMTTIQAC